MPQKTAILLVNLGTPDEASCPAIRRFLKAFLWDKRVVQLPRWLWWCVLNAWILPFRSFKLLKAYRSIWLPEGSPLRVHTQKLAHNVQNDLSMRHKMDDVTVLHAMTYGSPSLAKVIDLIASTGFKKLIVLPLFPQFSDTTTAAVFDGVSRCFAQKSYLPHFIFVNEYYQERVYQKGLALHIQNFWLTTGMRHHLLFSFHGLPKSRLTAQNDYQTRCVETAESIAKLLKIPENQWSIGFQSRFGKTEWIKPYTDAILLNLVDRGILWVDVMCPGFSTDCLETLEEINVMNHQNFIKTGGRLFRYIPAMNDSPFHVEILSHILRKYLVNALPF